MAAAVNAGGVTTVVNVVVNVVASAEMSVARATAAVTVTARTAVVAAVKVVKAATRARRVLMLPPKQVLHPLRAKNAPRAATIVATAAHGPIATAHRVPRSWPTPRCRWPRAPQRRRLLSTAPRALKARPRVNAKAAAGVAVVVAVTAAKAAVTR